MVLGGSASTTRRNRARPGSCALLGHTVWSRGAIAAVLCGAAATLIMALTLYTAFGPPVYWPPPVAFGLSMCFASFAVVSIRGGLGAWLYFHWLRRRLARAGLLPGELARVPGLVLHARTRLAAGIRRI